MRCSRKDESSRQQQQQQQQVVLCHPPYTAKQRAIEAQGRPPRDRATTSAVVVVAAFVFHPSKA